jgi:hypothetical protein
MVRLIQNKANNKRGVYYEENIIIMLVECMDCEQKTEEKGSPALMIASITRRAILDDLRDHRAAATQAASNTTKVIVAHLIRGVYSICLGLGEIL